jgi:hypothetical protein
VLRRQEEEEEDQEEEGNFWNLLLKQERGIR